MFGNNLQIPPSPLPPKHFENNGEENWVYAAANETHNAHFPLFEWFHPHGFCALPMGGVEGRGGDVRYRASALGGSLAAAHSQRECFSRTNAGNTCSKMRSIAVPVICGV